MRTWLLFNCLLFLAASRLSAEAGPLRLAFGVNYLGGQVRYGLTPRSSAELRYLTGGEEADAGRITSRVFGLRVYRFFSADASYRLFLGAEAAFVGSEQKNTSYKVSGPAVGGFGGLEYFFGRRFSLGFDLGPYVLSLREKDTGASDVSLEFIANAFFTFYAF